MTSEELKPFCSTDDSRHHLQAPFSREDWTFATNGHICVRVSRLAEVGEVEGTPDCTIIFAGENFEDPARQWVDTPEPEIEVAQCTYCKGSAFLMPCPSCAGGDEYVNCSRCKDALEIPCSKGAKGAEPCKSCEGGTVRSGYNLIAGPKGETKLAGIYIELIRLLPNSKIGLFGNESDWVGTHKRKDNPPVCFRFDGGIGLLMPVRK